MALMWRALRRRVPSLVGRGLVVLLATLVLINVSFPNHPDAAPVSRGTDFERIRFKNAPGINSNEDIADIRPPLAPAGNAQQPQAIQQPALPPRKDRSKEFYKNIVIHFDLKGAPPKVDYFIQLLRFIAKSGATGVLMEWEDMFPYTGVLEVARNTDAYSLDDVKKILSEARSLQLDVIPLVQTFGHLEWILKYEQFAKHRENEAYPQVLCLGDAEGVKLVKEALRQVIAVHKEFGIPFFHIGADEAFEYGVCAADLAWMRSRGSGATKAHLAANHLADIAKFVKNEAGTETAVLAWNDMLKEWPVQIIRDHNMGDLLEPVVWDYSEQIVTVSDFTWQQLATSFPTVWASSAYKGANFPSAQYSDIRHYNNNNRQWINVKSAAESRFKRGFRGIIITGWQRYDHFAMLCEILPIGTPSMILQLEVALAGSFQNEGEVRGRAAHKLGCSANDLAMDPKRIVGNCKFPGSEVYNLFQGEIQRVIPEIEQQLKSHHPTMGWLSPYNIRFNITQNWYLGQIRTHLQGLHGQSARLEQMLRSEMSKLFKESTVEEFIFESIGQLTQKIQTLLTELERLTKLRTFPRREFPAKAFPLGH